jgi:dTDP-glucose 4,6-dehydratase
MSKRILITGGAGFIGHHIIESILKNTDWNIISLDRLGISGNLNRLTDLDVWEDHKQRVKFLHHDLRSPINDWLKANIGEVDYILHMAASTHVDRSIDDPMSFVLDNVVATTNILEFAKTQYETLEAFLYFSTDEVFGPAPEGTAYKEWDRYNSGNPYAAAKAGGEEMALAYANTYKLPVMITHTMNVFGERQHPEKFIPMCIKKIISGETITIHANKDKTKAGSRFWIHGRNVADAILFLFKMRNDQINSDTRGIKTPVMDKFNIVGEKEVDNLQMANFIALVLEKELKYEMVDFHSSRPGHDLRYGLDGEKMKSLGWDVPVGFEDSLRKTIEWTIKNDKWLNK